MDSFKSFWNKAIFVMTSFFLTVLAIFGIHNISENWMLNNVPSFNGGKYSSVAYNTGSGLESDYKAPSDNDSYMQVIRNTTPTTAKLYQNKLKRKGYKKIFENKIEDNNYYAYAKDDKQVYFYFNKNKNETRVIDDCCSDRLDEFGYKFNSGEASTVYQFTFPYYDAEFNTDDTIYSRNGMLYVIKLADNKLIIIDGGSITQSSDKNIEIFMDFIREITNTTDGEKIDVALWYGTHGHSDHITFINKLIKLHSADFNFERFMFNYQSYSNLEYNKRADMFRTQIREVYPEAKYVKCRSGYKFNIANLELEILYTHEDFVNAEDCTFEADDANDASSVLKIYNAGKTFLFLGDSNIIVQRNLLKNFTEKTLHVDVIQGAHHMINHPRTLYNTIQPDYVFCPQSKHRTIVTSAFKSYQTLSQYVDEENFLFADQGIYGLTPDGDGINVSFIDRQCTPYDNSDA